MNETKYTKLNFTPLLNRVILKMEEVDEKTAGGLLYKPDTAKEVPMSGVVVAIGDGKYLGDGTHRPVNVRVDDRVCVGRWVGQEIVVDGEKYKVLFDEDILGVFHAEGR